MASAESGELARGFRELIRRIQRTRKTWFDTSEPGFPPLPLPIQGIIALPIPLTPYKKIFWYRVWTTRTWADWVRMLTACEIDCLSRNLELALPPPGARLMPGVPVIPTVSNIPSHHRSPEHISCRVSVSMSAWFPNSSDAVHFVLQIANRSLKKPLNCYILILDNHQLKKKSNNQWQSRQKRRRSW